MTYFQATISLSRQAEGGRGVKSFCLVNNGHPNENTIKCILAKQLSNSDYIT